MKHCNLDALLQLVRPKDVKISYFEVAADDRCAMMFNERIVSLGIKQEYAYHPLVRIEIEILAEALFRSGMNIVREILDPEERRAAIVELDE